MLVDETFHMSKLKCFQYGAGDGEEGFENHAVVKLSDLNNLQGFRTIHFTESFQKTDKISHANRNILVFKILEQGNSFDSILEQLFSLSALCNERKNTLIKELKTSKNCVFRPSSQSNQKNPGSSSTFN